MYTVVPMCLVSCLAVNDLVKGRQLDSILDQLPELWHIMLKLLDDIKVGLSSDNSF